MFVYLFYPYVLVDIRQQLFNKIHLNNVYTCSYIIFKINTMPFTFLLFLYAYIIGIMQKHDKIHLNDLLALIFFLIYCLLQCYFS